jgi:hypothetical protein
LRNDHSKEPIALSGTPLLKKVVEELGTMVFSEALTLGEPVSRANESARCVAIAVRFQKKP